MTSTSVESIIESFPHSTLPKIEGEPDFASIKNIEKLLITNASSCESELGGGQHRMLGLIISPERYQAITGHEFIPHANPGALPTFPANPTQPQITQINATHKEQLRLWREQNLTAKAIKKQLVSVWNPKFLEEIHDNYTGYNNQSIQQIFTYLYEKYGDLDEADVERLETILTEPYDPNEPFGSFVSRIETVMETAEAAGCPYTTSQIVNKAFNVINKSNAYPEGCREWKRKAPGDKTWANLKSHFTVEAKEYRKRNTSTAREDFQVANSANQALLQAQSDFRDYTSNFLAEFQNAMNKENIAPSDSIQQAHASSQGISTTISNLQEQVKELRQQNTLLLKTIDLLSKDSGKSSKNTRTPRPWKYCWTHGANQSHDSKDCLLKRRNHKDDATLQDIKGGSKLRMTSKEYPQANATIAYLDSAASDNYGTPDCPIENEQRIANPSPILLSNGDYMIPDKQGQLPNLPQVSNDCKTVQICPQNKNATLLSLGRLCDDNCTAIMNKHLTVVYKDWTPIIKAPRCPKTGMYLVNLNNPLSMSNATIKHSSPKVIQIHNFTSLSRLKFLHGAIGSPPISTLKRAAKAGYLLSWPEFHIKALAKLETPDHTTLGHMDQKRKNIQSTRTRQEDFDWNETLNSQTPNKTNDFFHSIVDFNDTIYTDQTGKFKYRSKKGYNYIFLTYSYDTNAILVRPIKSRKASELLLTLQEIHSYLANRGFKPKHQILDNETSMLVTNFLKTSNVSFQLVPPHIHRRNAAERAIRTFKNHFITILCSVHPDFPMNLWCRLLPQSEMTLNMLRPCRFNPKMSAYTALEGEFDYNKTPLAPLGSKVIAFKPPGVRQTWAPHGTLAWTIGPAVNHYRCLSVYVPKTNATITADTFQWSEDNVFRLPTITNEEQLTIAAHHLADALQQHQTYNLPHITYAQQIDKLCSLFRDKVEDIIHQKLSPTHTDTHSNDDRQDNNVSHIDTVIPPRVPEDSIHTQQAPRVDVSNEPPELIEESEYSPQTPALNTSKDYLVSQKPILTPTHRYPTRFTTAKAASTVQVEQDQITNPAPVTHNYPIDHIESPDRLKYAELIKGPDKPIWEKGMCNELGRLAQGYGNVKGKNTIFFIHRNQVPRNKRVTYGRIVCAIRPQKTETHRVRLTAGGNLIEYPGVTSTPTASIKTIKMHWNSVISTPTSRYCTIDIKDFYLNSKLEEYEYMRLPVDLIPNEIMDLYNLHDLVCDGFIYIEVRGGMYGLPQAGRLAHDELKTHLAPYGYKPVTYTPGLWVNIKRKISFTLVVDDFGIKYDLSNNNLKHLIYALEQKYTITVDMTGNLFCGVTLDWNYDKGEVKCSMPGAIPKFLEKLHHQAPTKKQFSPHPAPTITYGTKIQTALVDNAPILNKKDNTLVRKIVGFALYMARMLDMTSLVSCNEISLQQCDATTKTLNLCSWLLDYLSTYPNPSITFKRSDMILWISSDSSYQSVSKSRSRVGGYHFLGNTYDPKKDMNIQRSLINAPIHVEASILRNIMSAASESEIAAAYVNAKDGVESRITLMEMGHPQPKTPLEIDNTTAFGILTKQLLPRRSKAIDMRFYWLRDRENQGQFNLYWSRGENNLADYFTKHHPASYHQKMRKLYMSSNLIGKYTTQESFARGCVNLVPYTSYPMT